MREVFDSRIPPHPDPLPQGEGIGSRQLRNLLIGLLLFIGVELWFLVMHGLGIRRYQPILLGIALVIAVVPPLARAFTQLLDRVRNPSPRAARITSLCVFVVASVFLYIEATYQKRAFGLRYHDEYSYRIQTQMLARGRLWEPAHPLPEFFENFQLLATPVYASIYFPGAAMLYAPGVWLHWPHWMIPLLASGVVLALTFRIFTELIDGIAGLLGALMTASLPLFREQSIMVMAQVPALLGALGLIWAFLCWRKAHGLLSVGLMGAIAGWLLIIRPVDALIAIIPVGIAMLVELRRESWRALIAIVTTGIVCAAPFLAIQFIFNRAVTGHLTDTPFDFYTRQVYPGGTYGFHDYDPAARPGWPLPQIQALYEARLRDLPNHTPGKKLVLWATGYLPTTIRNVLPHSLLIILLPLGLIGLRGRHWLLLAMLPLFVALYLPYVFFIRHYTLTVMPAIFLIVLLGLSVLVNSSAKLRPHLLTFLVMGVVFLTVSQWPQFDRVAFDEHIDTSLLRTIDEQIAKIPDRPAIVLFRFAPNGSTDVEPVYNSDVAWPDDAPVIRAHDRGEKNIELFRYYAQRQPDRFVYLYDRGDDSLTPLGRVTALAGEKP